MNISIIDINSGVDSGTLAVIVLTAITALSACAAAVFTLLAALATKKATRGAALGICLDKYILIMKGKSKAIGEKNKEMAEDFYRELFDLHWSEFHLWHDGIIPDKVMRAWLLIRHKNYKEDKITWESNGEQIQITYKSQWKRLIDGGYFENDDPFVKFMRRAHSRPVSNMKELKRLKKDTKKLKKTTKK